MKSNNEARLLIWQFC